MKLPSFTSKREKNLYLQGGFYVASIATLYAIVFFLVNRGLTMLKIILNIP